MISGCGMPARSFILLTPDHKDVYRMPALPLTAPPAPFRFQESANKDLGKRLRLNVWAPLVPVTRNLDQVLEWYPNQAFVIIRNDTVLYEYYREGKSAAQFPSYSVAKSFISALVGFALQDGLLGSINDPVAKYLPGICDDPRYGRVTLQHLLNHTSGMEHSLTIDGLLYYGNHIDKGFRHMRFVHEPGTNQAYMNINTLLLGFVLEKVTGAPLSTYMQQKLWTPLGMEYDAQWSTDRDGRIKPYCCLQAAARDYAKLGRLYMHKGEWQGQQLLNRSWIEQSIARDTTDGGTFGYHNSWYIGYGPYGDFLAIGLYRQHLYVYPEKGIVIVALNRRPHGKEEKKFNFEDFLHQLVDQL
jgi:CubicO group peptidase (beta-lactamase class C family)